MDLEKLGKKIDKLLERENKETLTNWLNERRVNANTSESNLNIPDVSNQRELLLEEMSN